MDWDSIIKEKFKSNFRNDWVYCDVGSCNGVYTNFFKTLNPKKIYSFEANLNNFNLINEVNDICVYENIAVSDKDGIEKIYSSSSSPGEHMSNILGYDVGYNKMQFSSDIKSIKLDTYFEDIKVDCIKIDVEGAELKVINGGINTIKNSKFCIIECHFDEDWADIYNILVSNELVFRNLITDETINKYSRPYQIYLQNT